MGKQQNQYFLCHVRLRNIYLQPILDTRRVWIQHIPIHFHAEEYEQTRHIIIGSLIPIYVKVLFSLEL